MEWYFLALISALLSAAAAVTQKRVLFDIEALEFSFILSVFNALLAVIFFFDQFYIDISTSALFLLFVKSVLGTFAFWCIMLAIKNMEISGALPLMVLTPGLVAIFSYLLIGESLSKIEIIGLVLLLAGIYILETKNNKSIFTPFIVFYKSKYHHYIVFALILFTATSIMDKYLLRDFAVEPKTFVVYQQIFLAINFFVLTLFVRKKLSHLPLYLNKKFIAWFILIAIFTIGYRYSQIEAVKLAPVALVLSVKRLSVLFASLYGGKIFSEHYLLRKTVAIIIMLTGAYFIVNF